MEVENPIIDEVSLFENDKSYYTALLEQLKSDNYLNTNDAYFEGELLEVKNTPSLIAFFDLPKEAKPNIGDVYQLSLNTDDVQKSINSAQAQRRMG